MHRSRAGAPVALAPRSPVLGRFAPRAPAPALAPLALAALALVALALVGGCSPSATPRPTEPAATPTPVPAATASSGAQPGQVDTEWGPIWETLPVDFPVLAGAQPAEADAVVSAAYTIPTTSFPNARAVAEEYGRQLAVAYVGGVNGPLEDGSYEASVSDGAGCNVRVLALPRGPEEIYVTVLYGASCPFDWPGQ